MIPKELQSKIKWLLRMLWQNTYGPIEYNPSTREQREKLGFSHEEGIAFYDECLAKSGIIEVKPGFWDFKNDPSASPA
jgi:hypothetical protein